MPALPLKTEFLVEKLRRASKEQARRSAFFTTSNISLNFDFWGLFFIKLQFFHDFNSYKEKKIQKKFLIFKIIGG